LFLATFCNAETINFPSLLETLYGLDDRAIGVRSPAGAKDFSCSLCVQTCSGAHPASCTMGTGGPSPGAKRGRGVTLTTHPDLVPRSRMSRSYNSSPPKRLYGVYCFAFFLLETLLNYLFPWHNRYNTALLIMASVYGLFNDVLNSSE
jgi:hypothetical protein